MKFFRGVSPQFQSFWSFDDKGKATTVIDEGIRPLDGQFRKAASYSTNDDSATHDSAAKQNPQATAPRVMTDRELLLSLHQKLIVIINGSSVSLVQFFTT